MELSERAEELAEHIIGPLVLGRPVCPVRPIGPDLALQLGSVQRMANDELRLEIDHLRLRRARRLVPIDVLGDLDGADWALGAALNDLLQVTNEELSSFATRSRHTALLDTTNQLCERIPPPANLYQAVARHAVFGRLLELGRTDTRVSWWTGSAIFRGQTAPERLLRWPSLRRVSIDRTTVPLAEMADWAPVEPAAYQQTLARLLSASPLTDLATAARAKPPFAWTHHTLALVATPNGRNLALRGFAHQEPSLAVWSRSSATIGQRAIQQLAAAAAALPPTSHAASVANGYVTCLQEAVTAWSNADEVERAQPAGRA